MDQRFPLRTSIPSQRAIASLPPLDTTPREPTETPPSPISNTHDPENSLPSRHTSSPAALLSATPSIISPEGSSSTGGLPPTIPSLEQPRPTHLTNPLSFQHEHRNQVPVEGEYRLSIPNQDAIVPAPPPYTRHILQPKHGGEQPGSRLQLIDVSAAVRALPTVPTAAVGQDNHLSSTSSPISEGPIASTIHPSGSITHQDSNTGLSIQSEQSTYSNVLLLQGSGEKEGKHGSTRRLCGVKLWWILLVIALILVLLSIVLGVTLRMVMKQNENSQSDNSNMPDNKPDDPSDHGPPPNSFPNGAFQVSLKTVDQDRACLAMVGDPVQKTSWACHLPQNSLYFKVEPKDPPPRSPPPSSSAAPGPQGPPPQQDYVITSVNNSGGAIYEGVQPFKFSRLPIFRDPETKRLGKRDGGCNYSFNTQYTKEIALNSWTVGKLSKMNLTEQSVQDGLLGYQLKERDYVWWCTWKNTTIEGKVWMDGSQAHMELSDSHDIVDPKKGEIHCLYGKISSGSFQEVKQQDFAQPPDEKKHQTVERMVKRRLRIRKWGELPVYKRANEQKKCSCKWQP